MHIVVECASLRFEYNCNLFDVVVDCSALETLQQNRRHSMFFQSVNLGEMVMCLEDLINYFAQPEDDMGTYFFFSICILIQMNGTKTS